MRENNNFRDYYDIVKKIGEGLNGTIYEVKLKDTNEKRAIKVYDKKRIMNQYLENNKDENAAEKEMKKNIDNFLNEIKIMKIVEGKNKQNINTIKFYEFFNTKDEFAIVMELSDFNLSNLNNQQIVNVHQIYQILTQLNNTFKIMYENKIVHRLIGLHNIMIKKINSNFIFKLGSYGLSTQLQDDEKLSDTAGTLFYMSPEILNGEQYNEKTDLWSLGIVIYCLLFKKFPFPGGTSSASEIYKQIIESKLENLQKTDNSDLNDLITKLLTINQNKRISWEDYFKHPFFSNNNRNKVEINYLMQKLKEEKNKNAKLNEKINQLLFELNEEKNKNKILEEKLKKYENETSIENKINKESLWMNNLLDKDKEIKELKQKLSRFPFELNEGEKLMTVTFKSFDQKIPHFSVICKNTDIFNQIEKQVYEEYKNYYDSDNYFVANGMKVQKYKSLDENKIRDHDVIMLYALDLNNI